MPPLPRPQILTSPYSERFTKNCVRVGPRRERERTIGANEFGKRHHGGGDGPFNFASPNLRLNADAETDTDSTNALAGSDAEYNLVPGVIDVQARSLLARTDLRTPEPITICVGECRHWARVTGLVSLGLCHLVLCFRMQLTKL